jgi:hypothetical protein
LGAEKLSSNPRLVAATALSGRSGRNQLSANPKSATTEATSKTGVSACT